MNLKSRRLAIIDTRVSAINGLNVNTRGNSDFIDILKRFYCLFTILPGVVSLSTPLRSPQIEYNLNIHFYKESAEKIVNSRSKVNPLVVRFTGIQIWHTAKYTVLHTYSLR